MNKNPDDSDIVQKFLEATRSPSESGNIIVRPEKVIPLIEKQIYHTRAQLILASEWIRDCLECQFDCKPSCRLFGYGTPRNIKRYFDKVPAKDLRNKIDGMFTQEELKSFRSEDVHTYDINGKFKAGDKTHNQEEAKRVIEDFEEETQNKIRNIENTIENSKDRVRKLQREIQKLEEKKPAISRAIYNLNFEINRTESESKKLLQWKCSESIDRASTPESVGFIIFFFAIIALLTDIAMNILLIIEKIFSATKREDPELVAKLKDFTKQKEDFYRKQENVMRTIGNKRKELTQLKEIEEPKQLEKSVELEQIQKNRVKKNFKKEKACLECNNNCEPYCSLFTYGDSRELYFTEIPARDVVDYDVERGRYFKKEQLLGRLDNIVFYEKDILDLSRFKVGDKAHNQAESRKLMEELENQIKEYEAAIRRILTSV